MNRLIRQESVTQKIFNKKNSFPTDRLYFLGIIRYRKHIFFYLALGGFNQNNYYYVLPYNKDISLFAREFDVAAVHS